MQDDTRREYIRRIHHVLDFIEQHLDADLSLEEIAKTAHYSPFHFHRVFLLVVGENLNEYVNRKRVERIASVLLVDVHTSVKDLAYQYGFNSESSFSRSFKKYYGITPTQFKSEGKALLSKIGIEPFKTEKYICSIDQLKQWTEMNAQIRVEQLPEMKLAGIMHMGGFEQIGSMFDRLMEWAYQKEVLPSTGFKAITLYHDNPNVTRDSRVRYTVCITVSGDIKADGDIRPLHISKGSYVTGHFEIEAKDIPKAWQSTNQWVLENDYRFRDGDYFEAYLNDPKTHPEGKFIIDICVPVEAKQRSKSARHKATGTTSANTANGQSEHAYKPLSYHELIRFMKELKTFFQKGYEAEFKFGNVYQGSEDYSYFSLTTSALRKQKLKFVIILDHKQIRFEICLSGQNKDVRKKYWKLFKGSDWQQYHLAENIDSSLTIVDHTLLNDPDFADTAALKEQIETESLKFINEMRDILE